MTLVLQDCLVLSPATAEHLQEEIDAIEAGSDVTDVVGTHADLERYDTSKLTDNDIIKVLQDETRDNAQTYYRWSTSSGEFSYVGKVDSKTYTAGNGIDITDDVISVAAPTLTNAATGRDSLAIGGTNTGLESVNVGIGSNTSRESVAIGYNSRGLNGYVTCVGCETASNSWFGVALGYLAKANAQHAIQIGTYGNGNETPNPDANTFKVANANGNFEIMSADGTIPEDRLSSTASATEGQVLILDSNKNAVWGDSTAVTFRRWEANE